MLNEKNDNVFNLLKKQSYGGHKSRTLILEV